MAPDSPTPRLLFVCVENSNRSQMAEAFARIHGRGRVEAFSAGSRPSGHVNPRAIAAMKDKGYDLTTHRSKSLDEVPPGPYAAVVTMGCGDACPWVPATLRQDWDLPDPRALPPEEFNKVRDDIERRVLQLLARLGINAGPFVVSHPCPVCEGRGKLSDQVCAACRGTGVERFFHGTKADLKPGDLIKPGHTANFGNRARTTTWVYFTGTLDAATWGAELAVGEGRGRIYAVEPTGPVEDDPNLTDKKFPGNPSKSYRTREPLRVTGEIVNWQGHSEEQLKTMRDAVERAKQQGIEPID